VPDKLDVPRLESFPKPLRPVVERVVSRILKTLVEGAQANVEWWWPYPALSGDIGMRFLHPDDHRELFHADPQEPAGGYWMSRWMGYGSYARYELHETFHGRKVPAHAYDYRMEFSVKGHRFRWDEPDSPIVPI